ncbi:MAG: allantoicase [Deltaproteobacteria bacterium]|nr:allantoicase [Deltaproteobacteria bacterium]MCW5807653.1 allantoicase [Deltaproteobacteria bacterium]
MSEQPAFLDLPDLASDAYGGAAIACNDEFFAEKENLVRATPAVWKEHEYTDRGKWMDGWETRRFRPIDGVAPARDSSVHDWCIVRLGMPGVIRGVVVDTAFFRGNYPDTCALYGACVDDPLDLAALETAAWVELLPRSPLEGNAQNAFAVANAQRFTHVRLDIYPDGGVARLRVHGDVVPQWGRLRALGGPIDLAALEHGAHVETCSDMFFGSRSNLIKPGPSRSMADGWETRRRRGPGHEWAIVRLASAGTIERLELDTSHFKGNYPARCEVEGVRAPGVPVERLEGWRPLIASPMQPHRRHVWDTELRRIGPVTHLRVGVFPCGGIARLRAWGELAHEASAGLAALNALGAAEATAALQRCCGSSRWAEAMAAARPFEDAAALLRIGERTWWSLGEADHREAFAAHPKIGAKKADSAWSADEQRGAAESAVAAELASANRAYDDRHGFLYIVCATGRSADAMLADLRARLSRSTAEELRTAAEEQAKITRLRLHKLIGELA